MKEFELQVWDGFSHHNRRFMAEDYNQAVRMSGISAHPPGWISLVVQL